MSTGLPTAQDWKPDNSVPVTCTCEPVRVNGHLSRHTPDCALARLARDQTAAAERQGAAIAKLTQAGRLILEAIGEDPDRPGLRDTPARFARFWAEFAGVNDGKMDTTFENDRVEHFDQMVVISDMRVWSLCEHHLLPFWCDVSIGYIPHKRILGLSKFGRIAKQAARQLNTQERLVERIARMVADRVETDNVAVVAEGEHLCMTMRGVQLPARMSTDVLWGLFRYNDGARSEFMRRAWVRR